MGARLCASIDAALEGHDARVAAEERAKRGESPHDDESASRHSRRRSRRSSFNDAQQHRRSRSRSRLKYAWSGGTDTIAEENAQMGATESPKDDSKEGRQSARAGCDNESTKGEAEEEQDSPPLGRQGSHSTSRSSRSGRSSRGAGDAASRTRFDVGSHKRSSQRGDEDVRSGSPHLHLITEEESVSAHPQAAAAAAKTQRWSPTGSSRIGCPSVVQDRWEGDEWNEHALTRASDREVAMSSLLVPGTPPLQSWMSKQPAFNYSMPVRIATVVEQRTLSPRDTPSLGFMQQRTGTASNAASPTHHHGHSHSFSFKPYSPFFLTPASTTVTLSETAAPQAPPRHSPSSSTTLPTLPPLQQLDSDFSASILAATSFNPADVSILLCDAEGAELECALLNAGYSVVLCEDALEAMSVLLQRPAAADAAEPLEVDADAVAAAGALAPAAADFHLVILDAAATTPQGFHLLDWLRGTRYTAHLPVLVSSSDGSIASTERWLRRGVADVLRKPHVPALALSTIFTLLTQRHQQLQLPGLQLRGDMYKSELVAEKLRRRRNKSLMLSPSTAGDVCHAPILLNVLVLSAHSVRISRTLLNSLGHSYLLNLIPCTSTTQVLQRLRQCDSESPSRHALRAMSSSVSDRIVGPLGADLLLLDEMMLGDSNDDREFAAALTTRGNADATDAAQASPMVPLMLLADSDSSAPALSLLSLLQRSLVGVLEMPLSAAIVQSKLGAFLCAVEQHRRRFQLAQRAQAYRILLTQMRSCPAAAASKRASARLSWAAINADDLYRQTSLVLSPPSDPSDFFSPPCSPLMPLAFGAQAENLAPPPLLGAAGHNVSPSGHSRRMSSRATVHESRIQESAEEFAFVKEA